MELERPNLFQWADWPILLLLFTFLMIFSLTLEWRNYREWTRFHDRVVEAEVMTQYVKIKETKRYTVLKMKTDDGVSFYTTAHEHLRPLVGYRLQLQAFTKALGFDDYLRGFYVYTRITKVYGEPSRRMALARAIASRFTELKEGQLYAALFMASPIDGEVRERLSALGVSHLMAISGFHLGLLSLLFALLLKPLWWGVQSRYMPFLHRRRTLFLSVALLLFSYVWFLDFVPSLSRAFTMMVVGFVLYDRGVKMLSMQTLVVAVVLLLALWPRFLWSLGFWLSVGGVFYLLLFVKRFPTLGPVKLFVGLHVWVYIMMLPAALYLFETFSLWHPLSIVWSMLFILYYPLVLGLGVMGWEGVLDGLLWGFLEQVQGHTISLRWELFFGHSAMAIAALWWSWGLRLLLLMGVAIFVGAIYEVTHL